VSEREREGERGVKKKSSMTREESMSVPPEEEVRKDIILSQRGIPLSLQL
jgi:hypothetical protein